jgi:hypothetical protein
MILNLLIVMHYIIRLYYYKMYRKSEEKQEIAKIEQDIKIINEMFRDMDEIINFQGYALTTIEDNFGNILIDVKRVENKIQNTEINMKLKIVSGVIMGVATGVGIPLVFMMGINAVIIGGSIGSISGAIISRLM